MQMKNKKGKKSRKSNGDPLPIDEIDKFSEILKALASSARLKLVNVLVKGEYTVSELCKLTGLKQSLVSQQLKILRLNNIVESRKEVPHTYYKLKEKNVISILSCLGKCGNG